MVKIRLRRMGAKMCIRDSTYTREAGLSPTSTTARPGLRSMPATWAATSSFTLAAKALPSI